jgi:hypothetical protein
VDGSIAVHRAHFTLEYECTGIPRPRGTCMIRAGVATNRVDRFGIGVRLDNPSREVRQGRIGIIGYDAELGSHVVGGITCSVSGHVLVQHRNNVTALFGIGSENMTRFKKPYLLCGVVCSDWPLAIVSLSNSVRKASRIVMLPEPPSFDAR